MNALRTSNVRVAWQFGVLSSPSLRNFCSVSHRQLQTATRDAEDERTLFEYTSGRWL
jgi:hypothetical protein